MTTLEAALADRTNLTPFEDSEVLAVGIEVRNAAGGLNEAMSIDPVELHKGDEITVVLRCVVDKIRFDGIKDTNGLRRVHILHANDAAIVDDDVVSEALDRQSDRIRKAKEEASGMIRLPYAEDLQEAHAAGDHAGGLVEGCPDCDAEVAAAANDD